MGRADDSLARKHIVVHEHRGIDVPVAAADDGTGACGSAGHFVGTDTQVVLATEIGLAHIAHDAAHVCLLVGGLERTDEQVVRHRDTGAGIAGHAQDAGHLHGGGVAVGRAGIDTAVNGALRFLTGNDAGDAHVLGGVGSFDIDGAPDVLYQVLAVGPGHYAAHTVFGRVAGVGHFTGENEVFHGIRARAVTDETGVLASLVDVKTLDGVALTVEGAGIGMRVIAHGSPQALLQIDVGRESGIVSRTVDDLGGIPEEFAAVVYLIRTVAAFRGRLVGFSLTGAEAVDIVVGVVAVLHNGRRAFVGVAVGGGRRGYFQFVRTEVHPCDVSKHVVFGLTVTVHHKLQLVHLRCGGQYCEP